MSNKRKAPPNVVDSDDVGCSGTLSEVQTLRCRFHDFASLTHRGRCTESRPLSCHGQKWSIKLYPRGIGGSDSDEENDSDEESASDDENTPVVVMIDIAEVTTPIKLKYAVRVGPVSKERTKTFGRRGIIGAGFYLASRADVLNPSKGYLDEDGALTIEIDMQIYVDRHIWRPKKKLQVDMLQALSSGQFSDVTFTVSGTRFPAHRIVLLTRAPVLASMAEDTDGKDVEVSGVNSDVFRAVLRFVYGDEVPSPADMKRNARALLEASDRFGCSHMKLHIEAEVVESILSTENAAEWILFADSHSCALLKEAAMSIYANDAEAVMDSPGWWAVEESAPIMAELTRALVGRRKRGAGQKKKDEVQRMSVSELREKLDEKGLDADGTREMLVERLVKAAGKDGNCGSCR